MASELRVNSSTNRSGLGTITYTDSGPIVSGVGTFANGLTVDGTQTTVKSLKLTGDNYNTNWFKTTNKLRFNDNAKATFGTSDDLSIFHNASDSVITHGAGGTGNLKILSGGAQSIECIKAGAVNIAHNGSTKLATTNTGAVVSGILTATTLSATSSIITTGNVVANGTMTVGSYGLFGSLVAADPGSDYYGTSNRFGGGISVQGGVHIDDSIVHVGDTNTKIRFPTADTISFETGGGERARITSGGEVRIISSGSNNDPAHLRLHCEDTSIVANDGIGQIRFAGRDSGGAAVSRTGALIQATAAAGWDTGQTTGYSATHLDFFTQNNSGTDTVAAGPRLRIDSGGSVSIGDAATHTYSAHAEGDDLVIGGAGWRGMTIYGEGGGGVIQFADAADNRVGQIMYNHSDNSMMFRTGGNATRLQITSTGNLEKRSGGSYFAYNSNGYYAKQDNYDNNGGKSYWYDGGSGNNNIVASIDGQTGNISSKGNIRILTAGQGIDFSTTSDAGGMSSEILDDYEEGSWTPIIHTQAGVSNCTYSYRHAYYTKVGRQVTAHFYISWTGATNHSGYIYFNNLPYTSANLSSNNAIGNVMLHSLPFPTNCTDAVLYMGTNTSGTNLYYSGNNVGWVAGQNSNAGQIIASITYFAN